MEPELRSCFSQTVMFNTESKATETTATWTEPQDIQSLKDELKSVCADRKKLQVDQALLVQRIETAEDDLLKARADLLEAVNLNDTTRNTFEEKTRLLDAMTVERNELKMSYLEKDNALRHLLEERDAVELKLSSMQKEDNAAEIDKLKETISSQNETLLILSKERDDSKTELVTCRQKLDLELVNLAQKTAKVKELDQFESFERDRVLILEKEREGYIAKELEIEATLNSTRADLETLRQESAELAKAKQDLTEQIKALSESLTKLGEEHSETQKSVNDSQKLLAELEVARLDVSARDKMKLDLEVRLEAALVSQAEKDEIMTKQTQELKVIQARVVDLDTQLNTMRVEHEAELDLADDRLESLLGKFELLEDTSRKLEQDYLEAKKEIALFKK